MSMFWRVTAPRPKCCTRGPLILDMVDLLVRVCMHAFSARCLPFSLLHIQPKQPCGPPRSRLPPPCGPAESRARGNTQSGPYCSAASQPERDPTSRKDEKKNMVTVGLKSSSLEGKERLLWRSHRPLEH